MATAKTLIFVLDNWNSAAGGIQTVNRELACAISKANPGIRAVALVLTATEAEIADAGRRNVKLIAGNENCTWAEVLLSKEVEQLDAKEVQAVIGHGHFSGRPAIALRNRFFKNALSIQFVHSSPIATEHLKEYRQDNYVVETQRKFEQDMELCGEADIVVCVGPRLFRYAKTALEARRVRARIVQVDCGLSKMEGKDRPPPTQPTLLCLGRTDSFNVKGLDIFARAARILTERWREHPTTRGRTQPAFAVRGAKEKPEQLAKRLTRLAGCMIEVRPYTTDHRQLDADFRGASVFVMPSREEGFGLVACEAISKNVPVLISAKSGLAELVRDAANEQLMRTEQWIIEHDASDEEVARRYADAALALLTTDQEHYQQQSAKLHSLLMSRCSWDAAATSLLAHIGEPRKDVTLEKASTKAIEDKPASTRGAPSRIRYSGRVAITQAGRQAIEDAKRLVVLFGGDMSWAKDYEHAVMDVTSRAKDVMVVYRRNNAPRVLENASVLKAAGATLFASSRDCSIRGILVDPDDSRDARFLVMDRRLRPNSSPVEVGRQGTEGQYEYTAVMYTREWDSQLISCAGSIFELIRQCCIKDEA